MQQVSGIVNFYEIKTSDKPIFRYDCMGYSLFYAPGCLCVVPEADAGVFQHKIAATSDAYWGKMLWEQAANAQQQYRALQNAPFEPECLTLYLHNDCNLACIYCYTNPTKKSNQRLELAAIDAAAHQVAINCQQKNLPFHVVFHGGGEPTLYRFDVEAVLDIIQRIASKYRLPLFRYIATNGVLSKSKAQWLARSFDLIGLSYDGLPELQNQQRPHCNGAKTAALLEQTANIIHQEGKKFHVRTTITGKSLYQQAEIATHICQTLMPQAIHFEPVYSGGRTSPDDIPAQELASIFVEGFLAARAIAASYNIPLSCSGSRLNAIHGPYCNVFRQVLNLVPGGLATACFKATDSFQVHEQNVAIGYYDAPSFGLDQPYIQMLRHKLGEFPDKCVNCFNRYHCVRGCPDTCLFNDSSSTSAFRCEVQRQLAFALLWEKAQILINDLKSNPLEGETARGTLVI